MVRAISETAVAMTVWRVRENPSASASSLARERAVTTSPSAVIAIRSSGGTSAPLGSRQQSQPFVEIERGANAVEGQPELHHGEGHLRLDADDDHVGSTQLHGLGDSRQRPRRERVDDVEHGEVDHRALDAGLAHLFRQSLLEIAQVGVGERVLHRRDQAPALAQDRDPHDAPALTTRRPRSRSASSTPPSSSATVVMLPRLIPRPTSVWATSRETPVTIAVAPMSRAASTVWIRWFATRESTAATPVTSSTTTRARRERMASSSCSVSCWARRDSSMPMIGMMSSPLRS